MNSYVYDIHIQENVIGGSESENLIFTECIKRIAKANNSQKINTLEIGILNGERCNHFLRCNPLVNHIGIDPIVPDSMESSLIGNVKTINENTSWAEDRFTFIQDYCENPEVYNQIGDNSIHLLFIDGDHNYEAVKRDFELYYNKVKQNGYIGIHDSRMYRGGAKFHPGPSKLADEIINGKHEKTKNLKLIGEAWALTVFEKLQ